MPSSSIILTFTSQRREAYGSAKQIYLNLMCSAGTKYKIHSIVEHPVFVDYVPDVA